MLKHSIIKISEKSEISISGGLQIEGMNNLKISTNRVYETLENRKLGTFAKNLISYIYVDFSASFYT